MSDFESVPAVPPPEEPEDKTIVNGAAFDWENEPPAKEPDFAALESEAVSNAKNEKAGGDFASSSESFSSSANSGAPKKDNKKTWIIIVIIAAVLLLCCCLSVIILFALMSSSGALDDYMFQLPSLLALT